MAMFIVSGRIVLIDDEDFNRVTSMKWHMACQRRGRTVGYPQHSIGARGNVLLHRFLLDCPKGMTIDHINGNALDNRKCNLRICTNAQNNWNKPKHPKKHGYKGVWFNKVVGWWYAAIHVNGKRIGLGNFRTAELAREAYNEASKKYHGEFGRTS